MNHQQLLTNQHGVISQNSSIFMKTLQGPQISSRSLRAYVMLGLVRPLKQKRKTARRSFKYSTLFRKRSSELDRKSNFEAALPV